MYPHFMDTTTVTSYLRSVTDMMARENSGLTYESIEALVLAYGKDWKAQNTADNAAAIESHGLSMGELRNCYANAASIAIGNEELTYVEGYAMPMYPPLPVQHAWLVDKGGNVIDVTWGQGGIDTGVEYVGIPFDADAVRRSARESEVWGMIGHWNSHYYVDGIPAGDLG